MADETPPLNPITVQAVALTIPAQTIAGTYYPERHTEHLCLVMTVATPPGPWTVWMSDDDAVDNFGGAAINAAPGTVPGAAICWVDTAHSRVGAREHDDGCADRWYGGCGCGAEAILAGDVRALLLEAGRQVLRGHHLRRDGRAAARRRQENEEFWRQAAGSAGRVLAGGSDAGWRLWEGNPPRNTGTVILPPGPVPGDLDPQFAGVAGDAVGLYAIRDPRQTPGRDAGSETGSADELDHDEPEPGYWGGIQQTMQQYPGALMDSSRYAAAEYEDPELRSLRRQIRTVNEQAGARRPPAGRGDPDPLEELLGAAPAGYRTPQENEQVGRLWTAYEARFRAFVAQQAALGR